MEIAGRKIGPDQPPYIVAEISGNHNGELNRALELISAAKTAGADAVKIQTFTPDSLTIDTDREEFKIKSGKWRGLTPYQIYTQTQTPREWHKQLFDHARNIGITLFSSPFSPDDVKFLEQFDPPAYKIASNEIHDIGLLETVRDTGKPVIISMGVDHMKNCRVPFDQSIPLYCIPEYPATQFNFATLEAIKTLYRIGGYNIGFSDHSLGTLAAIVAVSLGACIVEKHLTLDRNDGGMDAHFSSEPDEFEKLVIDCRAAWGMLGEVKYPGDDLPANVFTRQFWTVREIKAGEVLTPDNVRSIRAPQGMGIRADMPVYGYIAVKDIGRHEPVTDACLTAYYGGAMQAVS